MSNTRKNEIEEMAQNLGVKPSRLQGILYGNIVAPANLARKIKALYPDAVEAVAPVSSEFLDPKWAEPVSPNVLRRARTKPPECSDACWRMEKSRRILARDGTDALLPDPDYLP